MKRNKSIGLFDSGFGGITIIRGIIKELPEYDFVYLGDTARTPYGTRSGEIVYEFTKQAVDFLFSHGCELVVSACNTVSSEALHQIQTEYIPGKYPKKRVLGVIIPAVESAARKTKNKKIGVIGTERTVKSGSFVREFAKIDPKIKVFQAACPLLVPIVESGEQNYKIIHTILLKYLKPLISKKIDTLVLGCTHYGILENKIKNIVGKNAKIISESKIIGKKLKDYLKRHPEMENRLAKNGRIKFYSTDLTDNFKILGSKFFGSKIEVQKVQLQ